MRPRRSDKTDRKWGDVLYSGLAGQVPHCGCGRGSRTKPPNVGWGVVRLSDGPSEAQHRHRATWGDSPLRKLDHRPVVNPRADGIGACLVDLPPSEVGPLLGEHRVLGGSFARPVERTTGDRSRDIRRYDPDFRTRTRATGPPFESNDREPSNRVSRPRPHTARSREEPGQGGPYEAEPPTEPRRPTGAFPAVASDRGA